MKRTLTAAVAPLALVAGTAANAQSVLPDSFPIGRDANGEPCIATRSWQDPRANSLFDVAYAITCRGVAASRRQAIAIAYLDTPKAGEDRCGDPIDRDLPDLGDARLRQCFDTALVSAVARIEFEAGGRRFRAEALPTAIGPLQNLLRAMARRDLPVVGTDPAPAPFALAELPPLPAGEAQTRVAEAFDPAATLREGIRLNHRGQFIEASRLLNDALSRLPADVAPLTRAEFQLEAGLADSNISQFDAAVDHFARADLLIAGATDLDRLAFLQSKRATYRGLHEINRRAWNDAIASLTDTAGTDDPLRDPAVLSSLNQPPDDGAAASVSATDAAQLSRLLVEAQRNWARSVAYLAIGDTARSRGALDESLPYVAELQRSVSTEGMAALKSRLERQYGRVAARDNRIADAIGHFDCAIAILQGVAVPAGRQCLLPDAQPLAASDSIGGGPLVAEAQLERASLLSRLPGTSDQALLAEFDTAVDALIATGAGGGAVQPALETYLDLLTRLHAATPDPAIEERFFRAVQAVGEPAIARQIAQLQNIVTADGQLAAKARDRAEAERQIIRLRYEIGATDPADRERLAALEAQRQSAEAALLGANVALSSDPRFRAVDDQPVTIAELRAQLRPGEYYVKVTRLRTSAYAMVIGTDRSFLHRLSAPAAAVDQIAQRVRQSIRDGSETLPFFDVAASFALFRLIAGPAEEALVAARGIVVDPSGPLENLPAGVLVTTQASVQDYARTRDTDPNDYSRVAFLGARAEMSSALSPRSFLITRRLPPSGAKQAFIGFGENAPAASIGAAGAAAVEFGSGCNIPYLQLAEAMNANRPVSAQEIAIAATALGIADAPRITEAAFTDAALVEQGERGDYLNYQVLHFATHGVPETRVGECTRVPPSLVTTLAPPDPAREFSSDGLLSLSEVARLRLDANLVVLSACETASGVSGVGGRLAGQDESSATLDGLVRAFVTANARAVLATYWQVPASEDTDRFIATFYSTGRTATIGTALSAAQRSLIADPATSHPYFWGAYFLVGDGSKTMLTTAAAQSTVAAR